MCGRFTLTADGTAVQTAFNLSETPLLQPRYNIAPTQPVAVVTNDAPDKLDHHAWGLVPFWAKDPKIGNRMINARSETAHEKPAFRAAFKYRRCLIPADGFFEWKAAENSKTKTPMYIFMEEHPVFAFAGLWERWNAEDGSELLSCTILTTEANDRMSGLHHRMPVILKPDDYDAWLHAEDEAVRRSLMQPYASEPIQYYPVSRQVNKPANDSPENVVPLEDDSSAQLELL